jgi:inner membrane transporter RhtA
VVVCLSDRCFLDRVRVDDSSKDRKAVDRGKTTAIGMMTAAILVLPIGWTQPAAIWLEPSVLISAVIIGVFSSALPFTLEMLALTRLPARAYGTLTSMEPVIGALLGLFLLNESLTLWQWAGIAGIAAAVLGTAMTTRST